ncbi:MAG: hypothetical protein KC503_34450 [Myxococcales bacterium]|nr:hypothetical protein [Myxococcales bacterium]
MTTRLVLLVALFVSLAASAAAAPTAAAAATSAEDDGGSTSASLAKRALLPRHRLVFQSLTAVQVNPLGVQTELRVDYRFRLFNSTSLLLRDSYIGAGFVGKVNPAFARVGAAITIQPAAVLTLRAQWEWRGYWGAFNNLMSFDSPNAEYDDDTRAELGDANRNYRGGGQQITLQAIARAKVGPIALVNDFSLLYFRMNLAGSDTVFYDAFIDALVPRDGPVLANHAHLLWVTKFGLIAGVRWTLMHAVYPASVFPGGSPTENINTPSHRVGPIVAYTFKSRGRFYQKPTVAAIVNWWVKNRYRAGTKVNQGVPYVVVAFRFDGDLWSH